ncbi:MAG: PAS domain S-box protein, partial [Lentisphaeria bacterium]|nr:PAS domain S-box protein [Lentisphaeria bacterium]
TQERYRLLVQNASDMILIMNKDGIIIDANNAALRMFKLKTLADLINRKFSDLSCLQPSDWSSLLIDPHQSVNPGISVQITSSAGVELDLSIASVPFEGEPLLIVFGRDVTERKRLEREREEWNIQASHRQRLEAIGRLAGGIAHDFNNYIHAIQGHLDIILLMHDVQDEAVLRNLKKIDHIAELAGTLTSQMLSFARKGSYQQEELRLNALVHKCAELFLPSTQSGIAFKIEADPDDPAIIGDPIQLQQALMNLMINAKDAMKKQPESEQSLTIRIGRPEKLGIKLNPPSDAGPPAAMRDYRVIRVEDTGPGIKPEVLPRLFEPFFTTKPAGEGTGMGLAMAYGTVVAHNGWIQVQNLPQAGAAFDVILPAFKLYSEGEKHSS